MTDLGWPLPDRLQGADGAPRRVGVEIELQGIRVDALAALVARVLGGEVRERSTAHFEVVTSDSASWRVEVDMQLLQELAREARDGDPIKGLLADALGAASSLLVPCEIVSPPLPMDRLARPMADLVTALHEAGARGTRHTPWYAFGLHFNVDLPNLDVSTQLAFLQAFVCAYDWLRWHGRVDPARRLTPYIDGYPRDFELLVTDPGYAADQDTLIDDYLAHNPTRNRALDLLPLFQHLDPERVRAVVDDDLVKPRPALHYRLANSSVDEPDWSIRHPWAEWVALERLAGDPAALAACCEAFRTHRSQLLHPVTANWRKASEQWLSA